MDPDPVALLASDAAPATAPSTSTPATSSTPSSPPPEVRKPNKAIAWLKKQWSKVSAETTKRPEYYRGRRLARMINEELDGRGKIHGPAHRAMFGESTSLVVENLVHGGDATTPIGFLTGASLEYAWVVWDENPKDVQATLCVHGGPPMTCPICSAPPPPPTPVMVPDDAPPPAPSAAAPISPERRKKARVKRRSS